MIAYRVNGRGMDDTGVTRNSLAEKYVSNIQKAVEIQVLNRAQ